MTNVLLFARRVKKIQTPVPPNPIEILRQLNENALKFHLAAFLSFNAFLGFLTNLQQRVETVRAAATYLDKPLTPDKVVTKEPNSNHI